MDQNLLVEGGIEDGQRLIRQLIRAQFEVEVAFWVKRDEDDLWRLHIASSSVDPKKVGDALHIVYTALDKIPICSITPLEITLLTDQDPIARDALALRDRFPTKEPMCYRLKRLGSLFAEELCIYPRRFPMKIRHLSDGSWQVLISEPDEVWLSCDSEDEARAIAAAPVLEAEALVQLKSGDHFANELEKTADALAKYRMSFGSRFLKRQAEVSRK